MRVLITQNHLVNFAGSEIATIELADYFLGQNYEVSIATNTLEDPIAEHVLKRRNLKLHILPDEKLDKLIENKHFDIVWVHHQLIPEALLSNKNYEDVRIVFHHMSSWYPLEFPIFDKIEEQIASAILFNSPETRDEILNKGVLKKIPNSKIKIFGNPAPESFMKEKKQHKRIKKILVISNHIPEEIEEALSIIKDEGIEVEIFGIENQKSNIYKKVEPDDVLNSSLVITIGKSVQYSILSATPVYCYDIFGGPGYLSISNFEKAKYHNFSGRGFSKKSPQIIAEEILNGYSLAQKNAIQIFNKYGSEFSLQKKIDEVLKIPKRSITFKDDSVSSVAFFKYLELVRQLYKSHETQRQEVLRIEAGRISQVTDLENKLSEVSENKNKLLQQLDEIHRSRLWKIRNFIASKIGKKVL